jgi:hypothetical protein
MHVRVLDAVNGGYASGNLDLVCIRHSRRGFTVHLHGRVAARKSSTLAASAISSAVIEGAGLPVSGAFPLVPGQFVTVTIQQGRLHERDSSKANESRAPRFCHTPGSVKQVHPRNEQIGGGIYVAKRVEVQGEVFVPRKTGT